MARPRAFDDETVLTAAMMTFWRHGYEGTTTRMLEQATGVGLRSLANAYGDKAQLFQTVLERYFAMVRGRLDTMFATPGLTALEAFFAHLGAPEPPDAIGHAGCLMVNTIFELEKAGPGTRAQIEAYRAMWKAHFQASLLADDIGEAEARSEFLVGLLWGALSQIKLAGDKSAAAAMARVAIDTLQGWRTDPT